MGRSRVGKNDGVGGGEWRGGGGLEGESGEGVGGGEWRGQTVKEALVTVFSFKWRI